MRLQIFLVAADAWRPDLAGSLVQAGHSVLVLESAEAALQAIRSVLPRILITSLELPQRSGLVLAELVKENRRTRGVLIIAMTRFASFEVEQLALEAGCDDCVDQSIAPTALLARIYQRLEGGPS